MGCYYIYSNMPSDILKQSNQLTINDLMEAQLKKLKSNANPIHTFLILQP